MQLCLKIYLTGMLNILTEQLYEGLIYVLEFWWRQQSCLRDNFT